MQTRTMLTPALLLITLAVGTGLIAGRTHGDASAQRTAATSGAAAKVFDLDPVHSSVVFRIKHMNVAHFFGRFNDISGSFLLDPASPEASTVNISIRTESVDTANSDRDRHLRSADFFSAREFPAITFKSTGVKKTGDTTFEVAGELTLRGTTRPITVTMENTGVGPGRRGGEVGGVYTEFTIKRSDFGMNYMPQALGDEVRIYVGLEGRRD
jgi:polyisoprenoid-binding protein YceI